jgi:hypothetical protein
VCLKGGLVSKAGKTRAPFLARDAPVFGPVQHFHSGDRTRDAGLGIVGRLGVTQGECPEQASPLSSMFLYLSFKSPTKSCIISQRVPSLNRLTRIKGTIVKGLLALGVYTVAIPLSGRSPDLIAPVLDATRAVESVPG